MYTPYKHELCTCTESPPFITEARQIKINTITNLAFTTFNDLSMIRCPYVFIIIIGLPAGSTRVH